MALTQIDLQYQSKNNSLTTEKIRNGAVTESKIADGAVTSSKIGLEAINNQHISDTANISISKLNTTNADFDSNGKLKDLVVTSDKIAAGSISDIHIANNASIDYSKLNIPDGALTIAKTNGLQAALDSKLNLSGGTMSGNIYMNNNYIKSLANPVDALDAATKSYVDDLISGITWKKPVIDIVPQLPTNPDVGDRYLLNAGENVNKIAEWDGSQWVYYTPENNWAVLIETTDSGFTYDHNSTDTFKWVQFTGAGQINAGVGLQKSGNTLSVRLGAGITELPTGEVGIDLASNSGLELVPDEGSAAELKVKVDNQTIRINSDGALEVFYREKLARERFITSGSTSNFQLSGTPLPNREILVYLDGLLMYEGENNDYTYDSQTRTVSFNFIPVSGSKVQVVYTVSF
ncbi:MAG: hypothetical protein QXL51_00385 [Candidatus Aenigmatarchaeota archaeon]